MGSNPKLSILNPPHGWHRCVLCKTARALSEWSSVFDDLEVFGLELRRRPHKQEFS